jgi:hypothetical protein
VSLNWGFLAGKLYQLVGRAADDVTDDVVHLCFSYQHSLFATYFVSIITLCCFVKGLDYLQCLCFFAYGKYKIKSK